MKKSILPTPFGSDIRFLNQTIETATQKKFSLKNKALVKTVIRFVGLPHFGARLRAYYLNRLLNKLNGSQKILDAGCGIGLNSFLAGRLDFMVVGVDNDPQKLSLAQKMQERTGYQNVSFLTGDLRELGFKSRSFDSVICFEVLEHIEDDNKAVGELARVLKQDGTLLLSVPGRGFLSRISRHRKNHAREGYSADEIKEKLGKHNLKIQEVIGLEHTPLGLLVRFLNDEISERSLVLSVLLFPLLYSLGFLDGFLPKIITPNNWIFIARKS